MSRRHRVDVLGTSMWVATLEDTILSKLEWSGRSGGLARQREDVAELIRLGVETLDRPYLLRWAYELEVLDAWRQLDREVDPS
ncbi:MAG: hypothetical protein AAGN82_08380 [Myxococcota bacterium]